jgi:hypothetical protein
VTPSAFGTSISTAEIAIPTLSTVGIYSGVQNLVMGP